MQKNRKRLLPLILILFLLPGGLFLIFSRFQHLTGPSENDTPLKEVRFDTGNFKSGQNETLTLSFSGNEGQPLLTVVKHTTPDSPAMCQRYRVSGPYAEEISSLINDSGIRKYYDPSDNKDKVESDDLLRCEVTYEDGASFTVSNRNGLKAKAHDSLLGIYFGLCNLMVNDNSELRLETEDASHIEAYYNGDLQCRVANETDVSLSVPDSFTLTLPSGMTREVSANDEEGKAAGGFTVPAEKAFSVLIDMNKEGEPLEEGHYTLSFGDELISFRLYRP